MKQILNTASIGRPITRGGISLFPLYIHTPGPDVIAAGAGIVQISELENAEVPTVQFTNVGDRKVLVPSGMVIEGGRQNRMVNVPVIIAGRTRLDVPVSCVQAGRWSEGHEFRFGRSVAPRRVRRVNSGTTNDNLRHGMKRADQGLVWNEVACELSTMGINSSTSNLDEMHEMLERDRERQAAIRELVAMGPLPGQCGIVVAHGRRVVSADIFGTADLLRANYEALVNAALLEVVGQLEGRPSVSSALRFVQRFARAASDQVEGTGLGTELHVTSSRLTGQALMLEDAVVYASCFALAA